jgi:hypothetical protein
MTPWLVADGLRSMLDDEEASEDGANQAPDVSSGSGIDC